MRRQRASWRRQQGLVALRVAILTVAVLIVAILGYRQIDRWRGPRLSLWVADSALDAGARVASQQISRREVRERNVPEGALLDREAVEGRVLLRAKTEGQPFTRSDFQQAGSGPGLTGAVPQGRVLLTLTPPGLPVRELSEGLRFGDRFDILAVGPPVGAATTGVVPAVATAVARDVFFMGTLAERPEATPSSNGGFADAIANSIRLTTRGSGGGQAQLMIGVRPEDVVSITQAKAAAVQLSLVFHGRAEVQKGELLRFSWPQRSGRQSRLVELILGGSRRSLPVAPL